MEQRVIALGFFDGVHIGHGALLRCTAARAGELGAVPAAVTFDAHPDEFTLGQGAPLLTTPAERIDLMRQLYGVQEVIVAKFDAELMHMDWREFVTGFLQAQHGAVHLVAGHDFHFGYRGEGNAQRLAELCAQLDIGCDIIPPVTLDGITVSSTYIRTLIAQGEMERAMEFLGHPYLITGEVRHGKKLGSTLGFPTVNLHIPPHGITPAFGVYAARVWVDGESYPSATNVGVRPTVDGNGAVTVEGFLLGFDGDLYGKSIRMEFYRHIRPEQKFESAQALRTQVMRDAETIQQYFKNLHS